MRAAGDDDALNVLLVEDCAPHAELIALAFERHFSRHFRQHRLTIASDIAAGRSILASETPDIVLADLVLPDGRGTDLIPSGAGEAAFPIVLLTSFGDQQIAVDAMKAGAHDYLVKTETVFAELPGTSERVVREWQEIRRRREAEQALFHMSRLATVGELIAGISHEINQPVFAIQNLQYACRNVLDTAEPDLAFLRSCIEDIGRAAVRTGDIIQRLKRFSRNPSPERVDTDLGKLLRETVDLLKFEFSRSQTRVHIWMPPEPMQIAVDPIQIQQVLVNLMRNAIEAMSEQTDSDSSDRSLTLTVSQTDNSSPTDNGVTISVRDSGPGLAAGTADIFDSFVTTKPDGLGMGLAISQAIVTAHGGKLTAHSPETGGAEFRIQIPAGSSTTAAN